MNGRAWWPWAVLVGLIAAAGGFVAYKARGLRNRNPGNIRPLDGGEKWQGQVGVDNAKGGPFVIFSSFFYGLRALARVLMNYRLKHGLYTVHGIISRWAPTVDNNNVSEYVLAVCDDMGVTPTQPVDTTNPVTLVKLMMAIVEHENGIQPLPALTFSTAASAAKVA